MWNQHDLAAREHDTREQGTHEHGTQYTKHNDKQVNTTHQRVVSLVVFRARCSRPPLSPRWLDTFPLDPGFALCAVSGRPFISRNMPYGAVICCIVPRLVGTLARCLRPRSRGVLLLL